MLSVPAPRLRPAPWRTPASGIVLALALLCASGAARADRAVIIGVGAYADPEYNLPGIDRDIANARKIITALGVPRAQQHVISDAAATAREIQAQIRWALAAGPRELAVIYFSGHGTHAVDAHGVSHSALVAHDFRPVGRGRAQGVILGSWIGQALGHSTAGRAFLLVDACESGTITKALWTGSDGQSERRVVTKYVANPGAPAAEPLFKAIIRQVETGRWVAMTAVQADQRAPASPVGSPFTTAVWTALTEADPTRITPLQLRNAAAQTLTSALGVPVDSSPTGVNPQVWGSNKILLNTPLDLRALDEPTVPASIERPVAAPRSNWSRLERLVARSEPGTVQLSGVKPQYRVGETLSLTLTLQRGGYLTLLNVDQDDAAAVIIPNRVLPTAKLEPGTHRLPAELFPRAARPFPIRAATPGEILLVALVTPRPIDLVARDARATFPELDEGQLERLEAQPLCAQDHCRLFLADVEDTDRRVAFVTRPEAVSVRTRIVP